MEKKGGGGGKTKPTGASRERRLKFKKIRSEIKKTRSRPDF